MQLSFNYCYISHWIEKQKMLENMQLSQISFVDKLSSLFHIFKSFSFDLPPKLPHKEPLWQAAYS